MGRGCSGWRRGGGGKQSQRPAWPMTWERVDHTKSPAFPVGSDRQCGRSSAGRALWSLSWYLCPSSSAPRGGQDSTEQSGGANYAILCSQECVPDPPPTGFLTGNHPILLLLSGRPGLEVPQRLGGCWSGQNTRLRQQEGRACPSLWPKGLGAAACPGVHPLLGLLAGVWLVQTSDSPGRCVRAATSQTSRRLYGDSPALWPGGWSGPWKV